MTTDRLVEKVEQDSVARPTEKDVPKPEGEPGAPPAPTVVLVEGGGDGQVHQDEPEGKVLHAWAVGWN